MVLSYERGATLRASVLELVLRRDAYFAGGDSDEETRMLAMAWKVRGFLSVFLVDRVIIRCGSRLAPFFRLLRFSGGSFPRGDQPSAAFLSLRFPLFRPSQCDSGFMRSVWL